MVAGSDVVEGQVRGVQSRSEQRGESDYEAVWTFRVERYDEAGNRVMLTPVEMRGRKFEGAINDGDWVQARGRMRAGTLRVKEVENLTTGAVVRAMGIPRAAIVFMVLAFIAWIAWMAFVMTR
ncbi:hypothetical protein ABZ746_21120 [Streptomyces sp. NPDC020096]